MVVRLLLRRQPQAGSSCPTGVQNIAEIGGRLRRRTASSCRRSARTACGWTPFLLTLFIVHLRLQHLRDHPVRPDAGERPHGAARCSWRSSSGSSTTSSASRKQGFFGYFKNILFPPGVPKAALHPRDADRVHLDVLVRPLSPGGPTLRQHARRPPAARRRFAVLTARCSTPPYDRRSGRCPFAPARRPHRLRDPRRRSCRPTSSRSSPPCTSAAPCTPSTDQQTDRRHHRASRPRSSRTPASSSRASPPSAAASSTAAPPSAPASASASWSATPSRPWPASPRPPAWSARPCSSASPSPRRSPSSASSSPSSSRAKERTMRTTQAARGRLRSPSASLGLAGAASRGDRDGHDEPTLEARPTRSASKLLRSGKDGRRLPEGAEPDPARDQRDHLGRASSFVVLFVLLWQVRLPGDQEGHGRPHRADPRRASTRPSRPRPKPQRSSTSTSAAGRRQERGRPHHRGGPPAGRRAARSDLRRAAEAEVAEMRGPGRGRHRGRPRRRPSPTSAGAGRASSPSSWPRRSSSATSTATPTAARSRTTSTRSGSQRS